MRKISRALAAPKNLDELFAFVYYAWASEEGGEEISSCLGRDTSTFRDYFKAEVLFLMAYKIAKLLVWSAFSLNTRRLLIQLIGDLKRKTHSPAEKCYYIN